MTKVLITPASYARAAEAIDRVFNDFPVEIMGKRVLIKPNVLRATRAEEAVVTHPAVLKAVVDRVAGMAPASLVVGDNPGLFSYGANEEAFRTTGLMEAAGQYYRNIGLDAVARPFNPRFMKSVNLSRAVLEADVVISLPKFKTHGLTVLTGAIKNSYGYLPGAQKARLHRIAGSAEPFHDLIVEVFRLRVPDLFIVDAVVGMEGNGPASPDLREIGKIIAGDNAVAVDAVMARMMGLDPGKLRFLQQAQEAGLGDYDLAGIDIVGDLEPIPDFKVPPMGGEALLDNEVIQEAIRSKTVLRPKADPETCTLCGTCVDHCPVSALTMTDRVPEVDPDTCIACFCCQEMCPEKAITLVG
jgi:uncharacterized protein (DUF362 family)/NAD-dependent dihydropyrimidine dehydrogenase PreA subunit